MPILQYRGANEPFVFKKGVTYMVQLWGAAGGGSCGNPGYAYAQIQTTSDTTFYFFVGGSPAGEGMHPSTGGWNGGGSGGAVKIMNWYHNVNRGYGGGGATHLGTNTNGNAQGAKLLVAAGSGGGTPDGYAGGGAGSNGNPYPRSEYYVTTNWTTNAEALAYMSEGGAGATEKAAGAGGRAPSYPKTPTSYEDWSTMNESRHRSSGGGGGGGYYGGGGGSTQLLYALNTATSGNAGGAGNSNGIGGGGGSNTTAIKGYDNGSYAGSGGGGSDFYRDGNANLKGGTTSMRSGLYPSKPVTTPHGVASIYPVYSEPEIRSIVRDGNNIVVSFGKSLDNNEEELFYIKGLISTQEDNQVEFGQVDTYVIIKDSQTVTRRYSIPKEHGNRIFTFSMTNGISSIKATHNFKVVRKAPTIEFNESSMPELLIQGNMLNNICKVTTEFQDMDYRCECTLIVDDIEFTTFTHGPGKCSIHLPYLYDGKNRDTYKLKLKARVCQTAECPYGTGDVIWGNWIESKEFTVVTEKAKPNNLMFLTDLKNKALCRSTKVDIEWVEIGTNLLSDKSYRLMLYKGNDLLQSFDCSNKSFGVVLDYPTGDYYKFGVSLLSNGFISEIIYTDEFYMTDIDPNSISFSQDLSVITNIQQNFHRVEVYVNDDMKLISFGNMNESLDLSHFINGTNKVGIRAYATETCYLYKEYEIYISYDENELQMLDVFNVTAKVSINNKEYNTIDMSNENSSMVDLGILENEITTTELYTGEVIEEMTQRITLSRKDPTSLDKIHVFKILGLVE